MISVSTKVVYLVCYQVNEAEKERNESEREHERTTINFKNSEERVQLLQKELKRAITKSK